MCDHNTLNRLDKEIDEIDAVMSELQKERWQLVTKYNDMLDLCMNGE